MGKGRGKARRCVCAGSSRLPFPAGQASGAGGQGRVPCLQMLGAPGQCRPSGQRQEASRTSAGGGTCWERSGKELGSVWTLPQGQELRTEAPDHSLLLTHSPGAGLALERQQGEGASQTSSSERREGVLPAVDPSRTQSQPLSG